MLRNRIVPDGRDGHGQGQSVEGGAPELTTPTTIPEDNSTQHSEQVKKPKWGSTRDLNRFLRRKKLIKILSVFASFGYVVLSFSVSNCSASSHNVSFRATKLTTPIYLDGYSTLSDSFGYSYSHSNLITKTHILMKTLYYPVKQAKFLDTASMM